jgi:dephospho-CoA kinase
VSKPLQIGVTGGIGSGKSLVCKIFAVLGAPVYDADSRAKWLMNNDAEVKISLLLEFGEESFTKNGLNRDYIAQLVFNDSAKLAKLNAIVHPAVGKDYAQWISKQNAKYSIKEAALMFESGAYKALDKIINVSAPEALRISRVVKRDTFRKKEEVQAIISKQLTEEERNNRSDYSLLNDEQQLLLPQIIALHNQFSNLY